MKIRKILKGFLTSLVLVGAVAVWGLILKWRGQVPLPFIPNVELITSAPTEPVHIDVPAFLPLGDYVIEVYSSVQGKDWIDAQTGEVVHLGQSQATAGLRDYQTPTVVYRQGFSEWTQINIPPVLTPGAYTVVMHVNYNLNPVKRVEQSALIAVIVIR